jgi:endonuclease III
VNDVGRSPALTLGSAVAALRRHYGESARPISRDPFQLILWEQVGYLVPDAQRRRAFLTLRREVGLRPADLLAASRGQLETIARLGGSIAVRARAARLRESAELVVSKWDGDLRAALRLPVREARRALGEFAMIGEPGAERILVITKRARLLPLDSNALRVLQRLGLAPEMRDYRSTYRRAQELLASSLPRSHQGLISASGLLRLHGQELCRRGAPACDRCPLRAACPSSTLRRPTRAIGLASRAARRGSRRPGAGPGL